MLALEPSAATSERSLLTNGPLCVHLRGRSGTGGNRTFPTFKATRQGAPIKTMARWKPGLFAIRMVRSRHIGGRARVLCSSC